MSTTVHAPATIAINTAVTGEIDITDRVLLGVYMPTAWTSAKISILAASAKSTDTPAGTSYGPVKNSGGTLFEMTVAADDRIWLDPTITAAARWIKLQSENSGTPENQLAARTLILVLGEQGRSV